MWTRKLLKTKAKERFKANYWRAVAAALLLAFLLGSLGSGGNSGQSASESGSLFDMGWEGDYSIQSGYERIKGEIENNFWALRGIEYATTIFAGAVILAVVIALAVAILLAIFLVNPLIVGCRKFFLQNLRAEGDLREIGSAFGSNYMNQVKIMFLKDLYEALWALLFIIPGIIKSYEYQMVPYILSDNPDISSKEAFALSKDMMYGNKWKAFVLDLSFIGWEILSAITFGIVGIFYVNPYVYQTEAALYQYLLEERKGSSGSNAGWDEETAV